MNNTRALSRAREQWTEVSWDKILGKKEEGRGGKNWWLRVPGLSPSSWSACVVSCRVRAGILPPFSVPAASPGARWSRDLPGQPRWAHRQVLQGGGRVAGKVHLPAHGMDGVCAGSPGHWWAMFRAAAAGLLHQTRSSPPSRPMCTYAFTRPVAASAR